ncbi:hypothetical protein [Neptuniibacter sp. 2_MG-2023]|uniref:L,D-transpeptidase Cds6 family protein n=1 Tax=Neptuniibacter sp. 2_MG-2023 TaxID=3062671 RepID=UPI0026E48092|nr:hypothetical protein [Neptuniibacter sp. 2_MG-2023]MDO6512704.1 hypothetical protein [Neptuniibacter sp. 2_MG-2023]
MNASELLLQNIDQHQVVRIEGSEIWINKLLAQTQQHYPDHFQCEGKLELLSLQAALASYLSVEQSASLILQALKKRLSMGRKLLITINCESVDVQALTYLLSLPSICDEQGTAVVVLLVSTPALVSALKVNPSLAAKLDGFYQDGFNANRPSASFAKNILWVGFVAVIGLGLWRWYSGFIDLAPEDKVSATIDEVVKDSMVPLTVELLDDAEVAKSEVVEQVPEPITPPIELNNEAVISESTRAPQNIDHAGSVAQSPMMLNPALVADLSVVVEEAKSSLQRDKSELTQRYMVANNADLPPNHRGGPDGRDVLKVISATPGKVLNHSLLEGATSKQQVTSVAALNNEDEVRKVFEIWHQAWQSQNWDAYIGSYIQDASLYGVDMPVEEWRRFRKERLLSPEWIKLELGTPTFTRLNTHWYRIEFYQRFEKPGYADETTKRLELELTTEGWRIASEATDGTVVLKRPGSEL